MKRRSENAIELVPTLHAIAICTESGFLFDTWEVTVYCDQHPDPVGSSTISVPAGYRAEARLIDALLTLGFSTYSWVVRDSTRQYGRVAPLHHPG